MVLYFTSKKPQSILCLKGFSVSFVKHTQWDFQRGKSFGGRKRIKFRYEEEICKGQGEEAISPEVGNLNVFGEMEQGVY